MRLTVPPVMGVDFKTSKGSARQLIAPAEILEGEWARFIVPSRSGWRLSTPDGRVLYVFPKKPSEGQIPTDGAILIGDVAEGIAELDLSKNKWLVQPNVIENITPEKVNDSWFTGFNYIDEDQLRDGQIGLRRPQLGALHAIHAHWSTKADVATVVMPTGTGKTETMLATLISAR
jgi:hypothetical protein